MYSGRKWESAFIGGSRRLGLTGLRRRHRRAGFAYIAIGMSPAMVEKHVGTGIAVPLDPAYASGAFLDGGKRYRLHSAPTSR